MGELMMTSEPPVLFIGGTGRCGSSVLREAFGNHSACGVLPFEHRFLIDPDGIVDFYSSSQEAWSPYNQDLRLKRLYIFLKTLAGGRMENSVNTDWLLSKEQYKGWNLKERIDEFDKLIADLISNLIDFKFDAKWVGGREFDGEKSIWFSHYKEKSAIINALQTFCWSAITRLLDGLDKRIYVEDNTWNLLYAQQLLEIFPKAKFVHIYRNPLDVIASYISQSWCPNDVMEAADFYVSLMDRWKQVQKMLPKDSFIEVSFESFVDNPKNIYENICHHMGIDFESSMLNVEILSTHKGKWKSRIGSDKHGLLKERLSDYISQYGEALTLDNF